MGTFIFELIKEHFGVVFTLFVMLIVLLVWASYHIGKKVEVLSNLPCQDHNRRIDEHNADLKRYNSDISEIKGNISMLLRLQTARPPKAYTPKRFDRFSGKQSPRKLNNNGIALFNEVKGQQFIDNNRDFLFNAIDVLAPKTAYDVEVSALSALRMNQDNAIFDGIKNWVYFAPARTITDDEGNPKQVEVDLDDVMFVISLPLRDAYLLEHPELVPIEDTEES